MNRRDVCFIASVCSAMTASVAPIVAEEPSPVIEAWVEGPALPTAAAGHAAAFANGRLYAIGGTTWDSGAKRWLDTIAAWSPSDAQWSHAGTLPRPSAYAIAIAPQDDADELLLMGGGESNRATAHVLGITLDDPAVQSHAPAPLPSATILGMGGRIGDTLVIAGGAMDVNDLSTAHARTLRRDTHDQRWTDAPAIPGEGRALAAFAVCGGELLVFGGCRQVRTQGVVNYRDAFAWSAATGQWRRVADLPMPVRGMVAAALDDRHVVLVGGFRDDMAGGQCSDAVLIYDRDNDTYTPTLPLPVAVATAAVVVHGDEVYVLGGEDAPRSRVRNVFVGRLSRRWAE